MARVQMTHSWRAFEEWWEVGVGSLEITATMGRMQQLVQQEFNEYDDDDQLYA